VILNLITNAIDSPRVIWIKSRVHDIGGAMASVEDTGTGVEPKDIDQIFNPLFTTKSHGIGMVLSICRSIIEAHDGRLWVALPSPRAPSFSLCCSPTVLRLLVLHE
jgi:signal transduction histidine kinase